MNKQTYNNLKFYYELKSELKKYTIKLNTMESKYEK